MRRRVAKKVVRRWLRGTPYDRHGQALPPYHSLTKYRRATLWHACAIIGREELRDNPGPDPWRGGRCYKWEPYDLWRP